jgi:hypothetical protein
MAKRASWTLIFPISPAKAIDAQLRPDAAFVSGTPFPVLLML